MNEGYAYTVVKKVYNKMVETVLADLKSRGFQRATIGVGISEERNQKLYYRLGFTTKIKDCYFDPCAMDNLMLRTAAQ